MNGYGIIVKNQGGKQMKNKFIEDIYKNAKTGIIVSAFSILLIFTLFNIGTILGVIGKLLYAIRYLFYGIIIAYIINQPMTFFENLIKKHIKKTNFLYKKRRSVALIMTIILIIILVIILASLIIPNLIDSLTLLISNASSFLKAIIQNIDDIFRYFHLDFRLENASTTKNLINMPWQDMTSKILTLLSQNAGGILENASNVLSQFGLLFTGFIFSLYLLSHKETYLRQLRKITAAVFGYKISCIIFLYAKKTNKIFSDFIGGQFIEACILWLLYYVTMRLLTFPYPELIATIIAIFSFVPFFGPIVAMFIGAILILSKNAFQAFWFMVYFQLLSQLEDNLIYPRVVGQSVGLPGIWVLLAILAFGDLFGLFGIVIAVPTSACLYTLVTELTNRMLTYRHIKITETTIEKTSSQ